MATEPENCPVCAAPIERPAGDSDASPSLRDDRCATCRAVLGTQDEQDASFRWAAREFGTRRLN